MRLGWIAALKRRSNLDPKFEESKLEFQLKCIRNTTVCFGITIIIYFFSIIIRGTAETQTLIGLPLFLALTFLLYISTFKSRATLAPLFFSVYLLLLLVGLFVFSRKYFNGDSKKEVFMAAFLASNIMCIVLLSRLSWFSVVFLLALQSGLVTSIISVDEPGINTSVAPEIPLVAVAIFVFFSQITYQLDSFERKQYHNREKKSKALESIKKVLSSSVPDQILVFPRDVFASKKLYFVNGPAAIAFNSESSLEIVQKLERIEFNEISSDTQNTLAHHDSMKNLKGFLQTFSKTEALKQFMCSISIVPEISHLNFNGKAPVRKQTYLHVSTSPNNISSHNDPVFPSNEFIIENSNQNGTFQGEKELLGGSEKETDDHDNEKQYEVHIGNIEWGDEDEEIAVILIIREISHRQKIIELQHLHELKDKMLASVSHDLRTPLNGIIGLIQTTLDMKLDPEVSETLRLAINSANSLLFLINDLLDISQLKNGKLSMNFSLMNVNELIEPVMKLVEFLAQKKNLSLLIENKLTYSQLVRVDTNRFRQILFNLLGNAVKFTKKGYVKLIICERKSQVLINKGGEMPGEKKYSTLNSEFSEEEHNQELDKIVDFTVEDTGIGIKAADIEKLKKPFGKLKNKENSSGVGLGLAISNTLAKMMGPTISSGIEIKSEFGKGSWFSFSLHAVSLREEVIGSQNGIFNENFRFTQRDPPRDFEIKVTRNLNHKTPVLIVDDDPVNQLVVRNYLKAFNNLEITTANNGVEALQAVGDALERSKHFEVIFMDCNMPILNGFESTEKINEMVANQKIRKPKIFALTGYNSEDERLKCQDLGMTVIVKPLHKETFISNVRAALLK